MSKVVWEVSDLYPVAKPKPAAPRESTVPVPASMTKLPTHGGFPVPWFVSDVPPPVERVPMKLGTALDDLAILREGEKSPPDFRVVDGRKIFEAIRKNRCWICGQEGLKRGFTFVGGPIGIFNRISAEPPSHRDCAIYAAKVCPFLSDPDRERRDANVPNTRELAGFHVSHNPGVVAIWITNTYRSQRLDGDGRMIFHRGDPSEVLWFHRGAPAAPADIERGAVKAMEVLRDVYKNGGFTAAEFYGKEREFKALLEKAGVTLR